MAHVELRLGRVLLLQGEVAGALELLEKALATFQEAGDLVASSLARQYLGEGLLAAGDFDASRQILEQAQADQEATTSLGWAGVRLALAELLLAQGESDRALRKARQSVDELAGGHRVFEIEGAYATLARCLEARGELDAATEAIGQAMAVTTTSASPSYRLDTLLAAASIDLAAGREDAAREQLQAVLAEATIHGFSLIELQARLKLGELELQAGRSRAGRARLEQVVGEAERKGLRLIARDARRVLAGTS